MAYQSDKKFNILTSKKLLAVKITYYYKSNFLLTSRFKRHNKPGHRSIVAQMVAHSPHNQKVMGLNPAGSYEIALRRMIYWIILVAEDYEPSIGIVCEPLIGSGY